MIYVLGSINMDLVARVPYMPAAGETLTADAYYVNQGGKGANQAAAIAKLGGRVEMLGRVGHDMYGAQLVEALHGFGVGTKGVGISDQPSGIALILVERGDNRIVLSPGANYDWTEAAVDAALASAGKGDMLIMQLEIPLPIVTYAARTAKQRGVTVLLNPAPAQSLPDELYASIDIIAPNETETKILTGIAPDTEQACLDAVRIFAARGVKHSIITLGARGAVVTDEDGALVSIPPRQVVPVDTTSAGDTFIGACAVRLTMGDSLPDAGRFASVASSITITRPGAASSIPTLKEVEEVIRTSCE